MHPNFVDQVRGAVYPQTREGTPPVIVMGSGVTMVAVLRLLHRAGIPTYSLCPLDDFARYSRWYRRPPGVCTHPTPRDLQQLLRTIPFESAVLLPCSDDWLSATAALPEELARRFPANVASLPVVKMMVDKCRFAQLLRRERIPCPRTSLLASADDLYSLPAEDFEAALLKPPSSVSFAANYGVKGFLVNTRAEALRVMERVDFPILLQEFIPGPPAAGYFVEGFLDRNGSLCGLFARRRLRMHPARLGNSTLMVSVPLDEVAGAVAPLQHLLQAVAYRGVFSAEFKYDERDGFFKLLEINARPWWYVDAPAHAGIDVCRMAYQDALHLPVEPVTDYISGQSLGFLPNDFRAWREQGRARETSLWSWLRSWRKVRSTPFSWNDPLPALAYGWLQLSNFLGCVTKRSVRPITQRAVLPARAEISAEQPALIADR